MRQRGIIFALILLLLGSIITGCSFASEQEKEGLEVRSFLLMFGGGADETVVSYNFHLWNWSEEPVNVSSIEPVLSKAAMDLLEGQGIRVELNETIESEASVYIEGQFNVNTEGMNKHQIIDADLDFENFKITTEQVLPVHREDVP